MDDQFGNVVTTDSSSVTLTVSSGPGSFDGSTTVAASSGIATFSNLILNTAGNYTLTASDGSLTPRDLQQLHGSAPRPSKLVYGQQPTNATAGVAVSPSVTVDVEDQFGNVVTSDNSNVTLSVASGPGSASGTLTVAASDGIATFSNLIRYRGQLHPGRQRRQFDPGDFEQLHRWSGRRFAGVTRLQPSNVTAGVAVSPSIVVDVEDQFGNIVTTDSSNVTLAVASGPGSAVAH